MTANPITDQVLADLRTVRRGLTSTPQPVLDSFDEFAARMWATLPDIDHGVIGQVLLHAGDLYWRMASAACGGSPPVEAFVAIRLLTEAGQRLYAPEMAP